MAAEGRAAGEAGQGPQASLVVGEQQVVAPRDRCGEGPPPFGSPTGRVAQQVEPVVEAARDLLHGERLRPGGGQLDGQRQPVEGLADVVDDGRGVRVEGRTGAMAAARAGRTARPTSAVRSGSTW